MQKEEINKKIEKQNRKGRTQNLLRKGSQEFGFFFFFYKKNEKKGLGKSPWRPAREERDVGFFLSLSLPLLAVEYVEGCLPVI